MSKIIKLTQPVGFDIFKRYYPSLYFPTKQEIITILKNVRGYTGVFHLQGILVWDDSVVVGLFIQHRTAEFDICGTCTLTAPDGLELSFWVDDCADIRAIRDDVERHYLRLLELCREAYS